jgi:Skp family chaperone for outer membrane proteins
MENNTNRLAVISLIVNAILVICVIILFVKMPSGTNGTEETTIQPTDSLDTSKMNEKGDNAVIVYYNSDSLNTQSKFVMELQKEIQDAQINAEKRLQSKQSELMKWDEGWQKKMPLLSTEEQKYMQEGQKKQQELMELQAQLEQELFETQNRLTLSGVNRITMYCANLASQKGYDYVISYQLGGQVLFCNPKMDITSELIELMNADYDSTGTAVVAEEAPVLEQ